jgi:hypothetical protein
VSRSKLGRYNANTVNVCGLIVTCIVSSTLAPFDRLYSETPIPLLPNYQIKKIPDGQPNFTHQTTSARKNTPSISPDKANKRMYKFIRNSTMFAPNNPACSDTNNFLENLITNYTLKISSEPRKKKKAAAPMKKP